MQAIIPVAGAGTRLRPHTHTLPKALIHVAGKPILGHILDTLVTAGVEELVLVVGYLGDRIVDYVKSSYRFQVRFVEQEERLGLGHAVHLAAPATHPDRPLLIVLGDTIFRADLAPVLNGKHSAIGVHEVDQPQNFGLVETRDGFVTRLVEKPERPTTNQAIVGVYYLKEAGLLFRALETLLQQGRRTRGEYQLTDALQILVEEGHPITTFPVEEWFDCGSPATLLSTNRRLLEENNREVPVIPGSVVLPPVAVDPSARLEGCIIGPNVSIAAGVRLARSIVRESIINEGAVVEDVLLAESIVGGRATVRGTYSRLNIGDSSDITLGRAFEAGAAH